MKGFLEFIREKGVAGLAVGFILGGAVSRVVASLVSDIIKPFLDFLLSPIGGLTHASFHIRSSEVQVGNFITALIDFVVIALVVYFGVKLIRLEKLDEKKEDEKKEKK